MRPWICGYVVSTATSGQLANSFGLYQVNITKGGTGIYTLTFTSTVPTAYYSTFTTLYNAIGFIQISVQLTTYLTVKTYNISGVAADMGFFVQVIAQ